MWPERTGVGQDKKIRANRSQQKNQPQSRGPIWPWSGPVRMDWTSVSSFDSVVFQKSFRKKSENLHKMAYIPATSSSCQLCWNFVHHFYTIKRKKKNPMPPIFIIFALPIEIWIKNLEKRCVTLVSFDNALRQDPCWYDFLIFCTMA